MDPAGAADNFVDDADAAEGGGGIGLGAVDGGVVDIEILLHVVNGISKLAVMVRLKPSKVKRTGGNGAEVAGRRQNKSAE